MAAPNWASRFCLLTSGAGQGPGQVAHCRPELRSVYSVSRRVPTWVARLKHWFELRTSGLRQHARPVPALSNDTKLLGLAASGAAQWRSHV